LCRYTPWVSQLVQELAPGALRQALQGQGRAQQVPAQNRLWALQLYDVLTQRGYKVFFLDQFVLAAGAGGVPRCPPTLSPISRRVRARFVFIPRHDALRWDLATRRAVEDDPDGEVVGEVLEPVLNSRGHEDEVSGFERIATAIVKEHAPAPHDDVDLVLDMRRLAVWGHRQGKQCPDSAALHDCYEVRARRPRDALLGFGKREHAATI
jgi:hypothetical protein